MTDTINLTFKNRPSSLYNLVLAFWGISRSFHSENGVTKIRAARKEFRIDPVHLRQYREICGLGTTDFLPLLYPLTLIFPLILRVLGHKKAPLTVFKTLNTRDRIIQIRPISVTEEVVPYCEISQYRVVPQGLELDLSTGLRSEGETIWECHKTFYYRGRFGVVTDEASGQDLPQISDAPPIARWHLPDRIGFSFARISGDTNGIHYNAWYARLFGFERDFAQPILILSYCMERLAAIKNSPQVYLDISYKGPVYYNRSIHMTGTEVNNGFRFDTFCQGNPRPCICGYFKPALPV
ncbi:hypothetical protein ACFL27_10360 [candidate division CSSED10-310 bacterium]|uniref:Acyl dehydratase n=1 Tax=candidate division CSSED10-310 bacterium TaxID=2855610 RepID=A0ABV6YWN3_UNCC1